MPRPPTAYRPDIDGLRAIAVLAVMVFHIDPAWLPGGYIGVDVFFVISGYLIAAQIVQELDGGSFDALRFYERRARRLLPALFLMLAVCIPLAWLILWPREFAEFGKSVAAVVLFASNFLFWQETGYFAAVAAEKPLLHTWSLAVEEQFYLSFPVGFALLWMRGRRAATVFVAAVAVASLSFAAWSVGPSPDANFFLPASRAWELMAGVLCALYLHGRARVRSELLAAAGIVMILASFAHQSPTPSPGTLVPVVGTSLLILADHGRVASLLSPRPLVTIGLFSYGAYLWHHPLLALARVHYSGQAPTVLLVGLVGLSLVIAYLSWRFVETPIRSGQLWRSDRGARVFYVGSAAAAVAALAIGSGLAVGRPHTLAFLQLDTAQRRIAAYMDSPLTQTALYRYGTCFLVDGSFTARADTCNGTNGPGSVFLWGDSHAAAFYPGLRRLTDNVAVYTTSDCLPFVDFDMPGVARCRGNNDYALARLSGIRPTLVVLHANWPDIPSYLHNIAHTIDAIRSASPGSGIAVIGGTPQWRRSLPEILVKAAAPMQADWRLANDFERQASADATLAAIARARDVQFVSVLSILCRSSGCLVYAPHDGQLEPLMWDRDHLTAGGSFLVARQAMGAIMPRESACDAACRPPHHNQEAATTVPGAASAAR